MSTPTVVRNDVALPLAEQVFGKKSPNAGKKFFAPVLDVANSDHVKWAGADNLNGLVNKGLRLIFADISTDPLNYYPPGHPEEGKINDEAMAADWADFTAGQAKLGDLEEQIDNLQALQQSYTIDNDDFGATDENGALTAEAAKLQQLVKENNGKIKNLRAQRDTIEEIYKARAAKRKSRESAAVAA